MTSVLAGRTALVTGAASGIGAAIATRAASDGATVVAVDRDEIGLKELADRVPDVIPVYCDLSVLESVDELPANIDVLVNCAGFLRLAPVHEYDVETYSTILRVMLEAPFRLARRVLPHMYATGWGRVINISSVHGHVAAPFKAPYVSAKHGLEGLSKVIALEGAPHGVTSNTIGPTHVNSPLIERQKVDESRLYGLSEADYVDQVLLDPVYVKRLVEPEEVAELAAVLYGPASASISGSSLSIDGGWTAH